GVAALAALGVAAAARGLDAGAAIEALAASAPAPAADFAIPALTAVAARAVAKAREDARWRGEADLARRATALVAEAAVDLLDGGVGAALASPSDPRGEAFALRAWAFSHALAQGRAVDVALRDRAIRLLLARRVGELLAARDEDDALREPIALVESVMRAHGLAAYVDDLEP
ncbi:MAG TPA: YkgJ family cysteine cluster protein, partial [Minicystis sp.]|nr:YkgJ family cysteine cluster protein [Minicystis sp.]